MMKADDIIFQLRQDNTLFNHLSPIPEWLMSELMERDQAIMELQEVNEALQAAGGRLNDHHREDQLIELIKVELVINSDISRKSMVKNADELLELIKEIANPQ